MRTEALTFRAEPEFIAAIRAYADRLGISANKALRQIIAPTLGLAKKVAKPRAYRNPVVGKFNGCLKGEDLSGMWAALDSQSRIDEEDWK